MKTKGWLLATALLVAGCAKPNATQMFSNAVEFQKAESYDQALDAYRELVKTYPDSARTPEALYALATIYHDQKHEYHQAINYYRLLATRYPHHQTASSAAFLIGFTYNNELKNYDSAKTAYEFFLTAYHDADSNLIASAKFELANLGKDPEVLFNEQHGPVNASAKK
jgi:TolA-binding protein